MIFVTSYSDVESIFSLYKHLLTIYYVLESVLDTLSIAVNQTIKALRNFCSRGRAILFYSSGRRRNNKYLCEMIVSSGKKMKQDRQIRVTRSNFVCTVSRSVTVIFGQQRPESSESEGHENI